MGRDCPLWPEQENPAYLQRFLRALTNQQVLTECLTVCIVI